MKQIRVHGPNDVRLDDIDDPAPGPRDALVRIAACGICGTDVSFVHMGGITGGPQALGHEVAGTVEWVGPEVTNAAVGDRVIVHPKGHDETRLGSGAPEGGLTPVLLVRDAASGGRLFRVPEGMPLRVAALAEPLGVGMQAVNQADVAPGDKVAVFGCGPVGLMAIATLVDRGIDDVVAVDLSAQRRELALGLGAAHAFDPTEVSVWRELKRVHGTAPFMYGPTAATDAFIEASGSDRVINEILERGRFGGRMSVVVLHYEPVPTSYVNILMKQFTIKGSFEYPPRFEDAIELLARKDLSHLITHTVTLDQYQDGLDLLEGSKDCGKVMVLIGEDAVTNGIHFDFAGTTVAVTGGTSGIGHAVASAFAAAGAAVTVTGTRPTAADYADVDLAPFTYEQLEMRDHDAVDAFAASVGPLDVLVNNAGANFPDGKDEWDPDGFSAVLDLNVEGAMRLTMRSRKALQASTMAGGASVVNVVSMTAFRSTTIVPGYSAAKAALLALTRNLAVHWAGRGIRVNAVAPGLIETRMTAPMQGLPEILDAELAKAAIRRMGTPEEIAAAVLFLSSEASAFTTGACFAVDGGYLAL